MNKKMSLISIFLPIFFLLFCYSVLILFHIFYPHLLLNSDLSSELVLAKLLAKENTLLSTTWCYSTELRVFVPLITAPLAEFIGDWSTLRMISNAILSCLLLCSYAFCMKQFSVKPRTIIFTAALLVVPFTSLYFDIVLFGAFYFPFLILGLLYIGLLWKLRNKQLHLCSKVLCWIFFVLVSSVGGLGGIRQVLILQLPVFLTAVLLSFGSESVKNFRGKIFDKTSLLRYFHSYSFRFHLTAFLGLAANLVGYLFNKLLSSYYSFSSFDSLSFIQQGSFFDQLENLFFGILSSFGFHTGNALFSIEGISSLASFVSIGCLCFMLFRLLKAKKHNRFLPIFFLISLSINFLTFLFIEGIYTDRYFIPILFWVIALFAYYLHIEKNTIYKAMIAILFIGCLLLSGFVNYCSYLQTNRTEKFMGVVNYLEEHEYDFGYATFWNANVITEMTDGEVEIASVISMDPLRPHYWLTNKDYFRPDYTDGKTFLLFSNSEWENHQASSLIRQGTVSYQDNAYTLLTFDSNRILYDSLHNLMPNVSIDENGEMTAPSISLEAGASIEISYSDLPPGNYTLRISCQSAVEQPLTFEVYSTKNDTEVKLTENAELISSGDFEQTFTLDALTPLPKFVFKNVSQQPAVITQLELK